jgi:hypothetical protein
MVVAKVNQNVAYVAFVVHLCCKRLSPLPNVSSVFSDICCKCVYLEVAYVSRICYKCVDSIIWL